jgi:hypothetical protein
MDTLLCDHNQTEIERFRALLTQMDYAKSRYSSTNASVALGLQSLRNLQSSAKKMLLTVPTTVVGENSTSVGLRPFLLRHSLEATESMSAVGRYATYIYTSDIISLKKWVLDSQRCIDRGKLLYWPLSHLMAENVHSSHGGDRESEFLKFVNRETFSFSLPSEIASTFPAAPHLGLVDGDIRVDRRDVVPLLNIDLPYIAEGSYDSLLKLMDDHPEQLDSFRGFLFGTLEQMRHAVLGSDDFSMNCRRLEKDIRDRVRQLDCDYKHTKLASAIALSGGVVAAWTLALVCLLKDGPNPPAFLTLQGQVLPIAQAYATYLLGKRRLTDNSVHFLWLIGQTVKRS